MTLTAVFSSLPALDILAARWRALEERGTGSVFLGWTWMQSWLSATDAKPELLAIQDEGHDVALALIGRSIHKRLLGSVPTLWLNQAGSPTLDRPFIEYNGFLTATDAPAGVEAVAMSALLARNDWSALRLSGLQPDSGLLKPGRFRRYILYDQSPAYLIDLDAVRDVGGDYLSLLSSNTRGQIKRAAKDYGASAKAAVTLATVDQIDPWLAEMQALNIGRHLDNAWEDIGFRAFVAALLRNGMPRGEAELLRVESGDQLLGLLLNLVYRGRAMNYQSAFAAPLSAKGKPGLLTHAAAISHYADQGLAAYSLLAGKDRYKQSLSTGSETLEWWSLERFSPRLEAEAALRKLLRRPASA
jgi:hypothetical protein